MTDQTEQIILGELRAIRRDQIELGLRTRVDTPWVVLKDQIQYCVQAISVIPLGVRVLIVMATFALGMGLAYHMPKVTAAGLDLLVLSLVFMGGE